MWTGPENEVLVWTFELDAIDPAGVAVVLSTDERDRAARFRFDIHRERYIAGRGALRYALGNLTGDAPESIEFEYGTHGKPELKRGQGLHFNLSHSENRAILGVTRAGPLGVDVERINPERSRDGIAQRFFAQEEIAGLAQLAGDDDDARADAFFQIWSRKEAVLKAVGTGIGGGLSSFAVPLDAMVEPVHIPAPDCWIGNLAHVFPYLAAEGFACAVALLSHRPHTRSICDRVLRIPVRRTFK